MTRDIAALGIVVMGLLVTWRAFITYRSCRSVGDKWIYAVGIIAGLFTTAIFIGALFRVNGGTDSVHPFWGRPAYLILLIAYGLLLIRSGTKNRRGGC
jgi:ABC-type Co2+ transport system permease subunit